jgi:hypothetical protein
MFAFPLVFYTVAATLMFGIVFLAPMAARSFRTLGQIAFVGASLFASAALAGFVGGAKATQLQTLGVGGLVFLVLGCVASALTIAMRHRNLGFGVRTTVAATLLLAPIALSLLHPVYVHWSHRAPSVDCLTSPHPFVVGSAVYHVPLLHFLDVDLQPHHKKRYYRGFFNRDRRALCQLTETATRQLPVVSLHFKIRGSEGAINTCQYFAKSELEKSICSRGRLTWPTRFFADDAPFPNSLRVSRDDDAKVGHRLVTRVSRSTFAESLDPDAAFQGALYFRHPTKLDPNGRPLTAACELRKPHINCTVAYPRADRTNFMFRYSSSFQEIIPRLAVLDEWSRAFVAQFEEPS